MLFGTRYRFVGERTPDDGKALLAAFAEHGSMDGTIAHYVMADGRGGLVISENDSMSEVYANMLHYQQWLEFETHPMLTMEDALPSLLAQYS
jgi:Domain of unknown function (DUF3303)